MGLQKKVGIFSILLLAVFSMVLFPSSSLAITLKEATGITPSSLDLSWSRSNSPSFSRYEIYQALEPINDLVTSRVPMLSEWFLFASCFLFVVIGVLFLKRRQRIFGISLIFLSISTMASGIIIISPIAIITYVDQTSFHLTDLSEDTTYYFRVCAFNKDGSFDLSNQISVHTPTSDFPKIILFSANPSSISAGDNSVLTWDVTEATSAAIDCGVGSLNPAGGSIAVRPSSTTTYTLIATNASGCTTAQVTIVVLANPVPSLHSINPTSIIAGGPEFTLTLTGDLFVKGSIVSFNDRQYSSTYISNTQISATIPSGAIVTSGNYPVKVINPSPGGGQSNSLTLAVKPTLDITITSPPNGETINKTKVMIKGTVMSDIRNIGIRVNGIIAEIAGNNWVANNVPITTGLNLIEAVAIDIYGNSVTKTLAVYGCELTQFIEFSASPASGIPPFQVQFSVSTTFLPMLYQVDFEGDGVIDYSGVAFNQLNHSYSQEGIFYPTVTVTDDQGRVYSDTIAIIALSKLDIDSLLIGIWERMKVSLSNQDIEGAVQQFVFGTQETYRKQFNGLKPILSKIVDELNTTQINLISIEDGTAEYEILVSRGGSIYSFSLRFIRDSAGVWKIWRY